MDDGTYIHINSPMSSAALKGCHEVQNLGAVQTYLRRYLWVTAMEIAPFKPVPKSDVIVPKAKVHTVMEGKVGDWQLKVTEDEGGNWATAVKLATEVCLGFAEQVEDVNNIFKNNRVIYDKLKEENKVVYDEILAQLKATKEKLIKE